MVVVVTPPRGRTTSLAQDGKEVLVEALVSHPSVETLDEAFLHQLA